jgi:hypothetical protein
MQAQSEKGQVQMIQMVKGASMFLELLKSQGATVLVIGFFAWVFYQKSLVLEARIDACKDDRIEMYERREQQMQEALKENTEVMRMFHLLLKEKMN